MLMPILTTRPLAAPAVSVAAGSPSETAMKILDMLNRHLLAGERMPPEALGRMMEALSDVLRLAPSAQDGALEFARRIEVFIGNLPPELRQIAEKSFMARTTPFGARPSTVAQDDVSAAEDAVETAVPRRETALPAGLAVRDTTEQQRQAPAQAWSHLQAAVPGMTPRLPDADPKRLQIMLREAFGDEDDVPDDNAAARQHEQGGDDQQQASTDDGAQPDISDVLANDDGSAPAAMDDMPSPEAIAEPAETFVATDAERMLDTDGTYTILSSGLSSGNAGDRDAGSGDTARDDAAVALSVWAGPVVRTEKDAVHPAPAAGLTVDEPLAPSAPGWQSPGTAGFAAIHRASEITRRSRLRPTAATPVRDIVATTTIVPSYDLSADREQPLPSAVTPQYEFSHRRETPAKSGRRDGLALEPGRAQAAGLGSPLATARDSGASDVYEVYRMLGGLG